jgi:ABC-type branched-subunit amino acid transport system ATPase component
MCLAVGRVLAIGDPHEVMAADQVREVYLGTDPDLEAVQ